MTNKEREQKKFGRQLAVFYEGLEDRRMRAKARGQNPDGAWYYYWVSCGGVGNLVPGTIANTMRKAKKMAIARGREVRIHSEGPNGVVIVRYTADGKSKPLTRGRYAPCQE